MRWRPTSSVAIDALHSPRFGTVRRQGYGSGRTGNHTDGDAWAILAPGTARVRDPGRPARIADIAATVAALCGVDLTASAGRALLWEPVTLRKRAQGACPSTDPRSHEGRRLAAHKFRRRGHRQRPRSTRPRNRELAKAGPAQAVQARVEQAE